MRRSVIEASEYVQHIGRRLGGKGRPVGECIELAALSLGWRYWRTYDIWYGRTWRIDSEEMDVLRARAGHIKRRK